jgi:hypothetical protein
MATQHELIVSQTVDFGQAVAVSGDYAIVGARQPNPNSLTSPGEAHIFVKAGYQLVRTVRVVAHQPTGHER